MTRYMHTIHGKPACMDRDGSQVVYVSGRFKGRLCNSLRQIRDEQGRTRTYRIMKGFGYDAAAYGHILIEVPD